MQAMTVFQTDDAPRPNGAVNTGIYSGNLPNVRVVDTARVAGGWVISAVGQGSGLCSDVTNAQRRHGWYHRRLQDLPVHRTVVTMRLRVNLWGWAPGSSFIFS